MTIYGVDCASYQRKPSWSKVQAAGISFGFSKVTEDTGYVNSTWAHNRVGMLALGDDFLPGAYHFLHGGDGAAQARHFLATAGDVSRFAVALDVEANGADAATSKAWVAEFKKHTNNHPVIGYVPRWYWEQIGRPDLSFFDSIWQSRYVNGAGGVKSLAAKINDGWWATFGGKPISILQFSSSATVPGITGQCDINVYRGSLAELKAVALAPKAAPPKPATAPPWPKRVLLFDPAKPVMQGADVLAWQRQMRARGWPLTVDGSYTAASAEVCRKFQLDSTQHGWPLTVDGKVGALTWKAAYERPVTP